MVKHITPAEPFGIFFSDGFLPIDQAHFPIAPPAPFRSMIPADQPFDSNFYLNMPVGTGMTYVSTGAAKHITLMGMVTNWNYNNWTDPYYKALATDPTSTGIEMHEFLAGQSADGTSQPRSWQNTTNAQTMTTFGMGKLLKKYTGNLRVPTNATWQSTSNTDRKVIVQFMYEVTLTETNYDKTTGAQVGSPVTTVYPAGTLKIETQKWQRISGSTVIYCTNLSKQNMVTGSGMLEGAVANNTAVDGYIRAWELAQIQAGNKFAIRHGLKIGLANANLLAGYLWPSNSQDGDSGSYSGTIPYGTHIVLPPSFNIETATIGGVALTTLQKAILYALQFYGAWVMIRSGNTGIISFGAEPRTPIMTTTEFNQAKAVTNFIIPSLRISANSNLVAGTGAGTYNAITRRANVPTPHGTGTAITAGKSLTDIDDATGLLLPINTDPATWV